MAKAQEICELDGPPVFDVGYKVRAIADVRNDGTHPDTNRGGYLLRAGEIGYVRSIGTYLQLYYIYGVDFYERGIVVGMRAKELELIDAHCNDPQ